MRRRRRTSLIRVFTYSDFEEYGYGFLWQQEILTSVVRFHRLNDYGAIVYRLGHQVFILRSGVRLPVALPNVLPNQQIV